MGDKRPCQLDFRSRRQACLAGVVKERELVLVAAESVLDRVVEGHGRIGGRQRNAGGVRAGACGQRTEFHEDQVVAVGVRVVSQELAGGDREGLVGIPGSVGGAVAMNAGSHGAETCKNIYNIQAFVDSTILISILMNSCSYVCLVS